MFGQGFDSPRLHKKKPWQFERNGHGTTSCPFSLLLSGMKFRLLVFVSLLSFYHASAQQGFQFAHITDLHIGSGQADEDLRRTVADINNNASLRFVIASGDITEFGSDQELRLAKQILDSLNKPYYIIPGNHDNNWSESGTNSFVKIFGSETFSFRYDSYYFLGTNCGPNMKMSPGQVSYENIVWLENSLKTLPKNAPVIFVNHYPLDSSLNNWYEITDRLKKYNIQLTIGGHWHQNTLLNYEGIPGVLGRSNLRAKEPVGGYNIVTFENDTAFYQTAIPQKETKEVWTQIALKNHQFSTQEIQYPRPSYAVNQEYPEVREVWRFQDSSDMGTGFVLYRNTIITPNTKGVVQCIDAQSGKAIWRFHTKGKIYSTPALSGNRLVIPSTDGTIYCLNAKNGKLLWKYTTQQSVVASPLIQKNIVFLGSSEGKFRTLNLITGKLIWEFKTAQGFQKSTPLLYDNKVYFAGWGNTLYALNAQNGKLVWKFEDGYSNRMLSPASCIPVALRGAVFFVAPDRYMTKLNAATGALVWKKNWKEHWVRESMGLSSDSTLIFAKTMQGRVIGVASQADTGRIVWQTPLVFGYELNPSQVKERDGVVYAFSDKGVIAAFDRETGAIKWMHKVANCLVNDVQFINSRELIASTMDGKIVKLKIH